MYIRTYVHVRRPDCACAKVVGILLGLLVLQLVPVQDMSQTQQESDHRRNWNDAGN